MKEMHFKQVFQKLVTGKNWVTDHVQTFLKTHPNKEICNTGNHQWAEMEAPGGWKAPLNCCFSESPLTFCQLEREQMITSHWNFYWVFSMVLDISGNKFWKNYSLVS